MSNLIRPYSVFEDFYRPLESVFARPQTAMLGESNNWLPLVDIKKNDDEFVIVMDVPGFSRDQVTVEAHDGTLTIKGERSSESESEEGVIRRERQYGSFARKFSLPEGTDEEHIGAVVKDGMLTIKVPHKAPAEPKKIAVE